MDISRELWSLVESARQSQSAASPPSARALPKNLATTLEQQQTKASLLSTSHTLGDAVVNAISRASLHVQAVVAALDAATPSSTTHLQNSVLLSDAELLSVSGSLKTFKETLDKVDMVVSAAKPRERAAAKRNKTASQGDGGLLEPEMGDAADHGTGLVAHLQQAVAIQEQRVAAKRLQVALAKEELALYKTEMFLYGHCGILSCSDMVAAQLERHRASSAVASSNARDVSRATEGDVMHLRRPHLSSATSFTTAFTGPSRSGFGTTFRVVDGMMQRAAQTVKAAHTQADSALQVAFTGSQAAARHLLHAGTSSVDDIVMLRSGPERGHTPSSTTGDNTGGAHAPILRVSALHLPSLPRDHLTQEEEARLQEQSQALLQVQHEASAQDAKAVEASIRELSQLTSLMNEQVVQQTEQFSILVRNTEAAHSNVQKAVVEVKKPLQSFWNPTRQLIALLWACIALLLAVNSIAR